MFSRLYLTVHVARCNRTILGVLVASLLGTASLSGQDSVIAGPIRNNTPGAYIDFMRPDQRPPLVGAAPAADSLWGPIEESELGDGVAESRRADLQELVRRFAPTLVLPKADHVRVEGRRYQLIPTDVQLVADTLQLDLIQAAPYMLYDSLSLVLRDLPTDSLVILTEKSLRYESGQTLMEAWYFDWVGTSPREWWPAYGELRTGADSALWAQPTVYAHPFIHSDGRLVIQYWFFYPFNDHVGNHEGDWEHINVIPTADRSGIDEVHYYFHVRSLKLPQGRYQPEVVDGTHTVVYAGGRLYNVLDFPVRWFAGEHNEGAHGTYPYPGEWEGAGGLGAPESVHRADRDSARVVPYHRFRVVLTPEPGRVDYRRHPEVLRDWIWLLLPVRWGFPSVTSVGAELGSVDVGNRAPFGPPYNPAWNRTAPGLHYPGYQVKKIGFVRSLIEDLLQPWYYLYIFRTPRFVDDARGAGNREALERLGLLPRGGWAEGGIGATLVGLNHGWASGGSSDVYNARTGASFWRNFWLKIRTGWIELVTGYQRFPRRTGPDGRLVVHPVTVNFVARAPNDWLFRPYLSAGGGAYYWRANWRNTNISQVNSSGWNFGVTPGVGLEYYLRPRVALDVGVRYHHTNIPSLDIDVGTGDLRFFTFWVGHYVRF